MSQGGYKGPSQPSGGGGTVVMIIVVVGALLGLGCLGVCGLGLFGFRFAAQQAGQEMQQAVATASVSMQEMAGQTILAATAADRVINDARVKEALGEPVSIAAGDPPAEPASADSCSFDLPLSGPKGKATGHVTGQRVATGWEMTSVTVTLSDGSTIDIDHNSTAPARGDAVPTSPPEITDPPESSDSSPQEPTP
jgi:hypothetical protein